ncbi:DUF2771 domain-containing protein [Skermania sp. ID1734]|uniref:DUF2771 domain-containing protein n=1 Tax=Skermania sp. ID1734 TaxID=2597516 RepID=UPI00117CE588|nr:DUF2771 domain-containing protein [Skermania sp. ID1734]TSD96620.1 DUF2771 domain-containing protein [Skermania sp. ID1734]
MKLPFAISRRLAALAAALFVVAVAFIVVMVVIIRGAKPPLPQITAYAHGKAITVSPYQYCTFNLADCKQGSIAQLDVPAGYPLQLSLPSEISKAPWRIIMSYVRPDGAMIIKERYYASNEASAVTVESDTNPAWQLAGVEIQIPSAVVDESGIPRVRGIWSIKTA